MTLITKYFEKRLTAKYRSGSFKVGTLSEYARSESAAARMQDRGEGSLSDSYSAQSGQIDHWTFGGGGQIHASVWENCGAGPILNRRMNEYVFCASLGGYDRRHHEQMLHGCEVENCGRYAGNPDLTCYAEIDLDEFLRGLRSWVTVKARRFRQDMDDSKEIGAINVTYRARAETFDDVPPIRDFSILSRDEYFRALSVKPLIFLPEREVRIGMYIHKDGLPPNDASPLFPKNASLRRSIVKMGEYRG